MLDNLIAQGRAVPMIGVMPQCYGEMSFVRNGFEAWNDPAQVARNIRLFDDALLEEIVPQVEADLSRQQRACDQRDFHGRGTEPAHRA